MQRESLIVLAALITVITLITGGAPLNYNVSPSAPTAEIVAPNVRHAPASRTSDTGLQWLFPVMATSQCNQSEPARKLSNAEFEEVIDSLLLNRSAADITI